MTNAPDARGGPDGSSLLSIGPYLTLGIQLALTVVVLFFVGRWCDEKLSTSPWLMLTGLFIGCTGGLIKFIRTATELAKQDDERARHTPGPGTPA